MRVLVSYGYVFGTRLWANLCRSYSVNFVGVVLPGDNLTTRSNTPPRTMSLALPLITSAEEKFSKVLRRGHNRLRVLGLCAHLVYVYTFLLRRSSVRAPRKRPSTLASQSASVIWRRPMTRQITSRVSRFLRTSTSAFFNTLSRVLKDIFLPLNLRRSPLGLSHARALRTKGSVQPDAAFAGHSLGEFSASIADILPNSSCRHCFIAV